MEFKKCCRCGNFYVSNDDVCPNCKVKDNFEFSTFKSYLDGNGLNNSLETISGETGISIKNLNRFLEYEVLQNCEDIVGNIENDNNTIKKLD